jgi:hypothetical protein
MEQPTSLKTECGDPYTTGIHSPLRRLPEDSKTARMAVRKKTFLKG